MTPLYIKTDNSLLESLIKIDDLISFAIKNNIKSLSITDNSMYGVLEFYLKCKENNIKPIVGLEISDIVLYAINYEGYKNLIKLETLRSTKEITILDLKQYSKNLICIVPYHNLNNFDNYKFYDYLYKGYTLLDEKRMLNGESVYLNEVLYLEEKDEVYLKYLYALKQGVSIKEVNIDKHDNHLLNYQLYFDENNEKITNLCNLELKFNQDLLPIYPCNNAYEYLKELVIKGLKEKFKDNNEIYLKRAKYELDIINKMGFCNYFLIVWDYVNYAIKENILVGPGRGSAAGSLVAYLLGITSIDPIKYDLLFERFLNPERISMPDIDIDFEYTRREEIINYCMNKYGIKNVAPIITFGTLSSKQVIRDLGKCMKIDSKTIDNLSKKIDPKLDLLTNYKLNIKTLPDNLKKLYKVALKLEGLKRHSSVHAAGIVMSRYPLDEIIPLKYHDNLYITGYSMEYLEKIGLLKMDLLALKNLTLINNVLKEINMKFCDIPLDSKEALLIFEKGDTTGIFQFESQGMINFLKKLKPSSFDDITLAIALYRPGPMDNIDSYIRRKNNEEQIDYIHEDLKSILSKTYGIIIYQEQIMQIAEKMANYTLGEADLLRKAMSKKNYDLLFNEKEKFINNALKNGYSSLTANKTYELILKFASYGFNKAHSVSYAMIAYKMAYLKAHYYQVFMKNLLSMVISSEVKTKEYIDILKCEILKPNINYSFEDYTIMMDKIVYPLSNIKGISKETSLKIVEERKKGLFKDIYDFFNRCYSFLNIKTIDVLNKAGCFEDLINQRSLDENMDILINYSELGQLLDDSLKPSLTMFKEYDVKEILLRQQEVFGFYLGNHPVSEYRYIKAIKLIDIASYFNKNVICLIYVLKVRKIKTKNNKDMYFITASDETAKLDFILFDYFDIKCNNIYVVSGKVEKRFDKYQVIISKIRGV